MKPTLLIMAAGLGSRYGGLKQIEPIGPHGEILLEFSLKDAIFLGIEDVVIVVSEAIKADFVSMIVPKYHDKLRITLVVQSLENIPENFKPQITNFTSRTKPWGTAHAVWCARDAIPGPCIVVNADDFYGRDAIKQAYDFLVGNDTGEKSDNRNHCIVTYPITSTLSPFGTVSRGICAVENGILTKIVEHTKVGWNNNHILIHTCEDGREIVVPEDALANMNLFGFQRSFFDVLDGECLKFFESHIGDPKYEFFLPTVVMHMISSGLGSVTALTTTSQWFGMTNPEDRIETAKRITQLMEDGILD